MNIMKNKDMLQGFEQNFHSRLAEGIYKFGHDSKRLMKWKAYSDR